MNDGNWKLHEQLARDTVPVGDLPLSRVLLANDANYPWLILVPRRQAAAELVDLEKADRTQLMDEVAATSAALKRETACDKLNVAALGNMVAQLHIHVIARRRGDPAWPKPVWGAAQPAAYAPHAREQFVANLRRGLQIAAVRD